MISKKARLNRSQSEQGTLPLLYRKRLDWTVLHPNGELCIVISKNTRKTVAPPNRELCIDISKKAKLNRCPIRTENSALLHRKRQDGTVLASQQRTLLYHVDKEMKNRCPFERWILHCYIETSKAEPFSHPNWEICIGIRKWQDLTKSCSVTRSHSWWLYALSVLRSTRTKKKQSTSFPSQAFEHPLFCTCNQTTFILFTEESVVTSEKTRLNRRPEN